MTLDQFVQKRIKAIFQDIAEGHYDLTEDELAGLPMTLFVAESHLLGAWREFMEASPIKGRS